MVCPGNIDWLDDFPGEGKPDRGLVACSCSRGVNWLVCLGMGGIG